MNPELNSPNDNSLEKVEKKDNAIVSAFMGLTKRERVMIYFLAIFVVIGGLGFLVFVPALDKTTTLQEEVDSLYAEKENFQMQISQTPSFKQQWEEANANLEKYKTFFYPVMQPETIDKTITSLIRSAGMRPQSLNISSLEMTSVPRFSPQPLSGEGADVFIQELYNSLNPNAVQSTGSAVESNAEGSVDPGDAESDQQIDEAEREEMGAEGAASGGESTYAYTVDVTAVADQEQLFSLIDAVAKMTALELISYDLTPPKEEIVNPGDILVGTPTQAAESGTISLQFKIYVYVPGLTSSPLPEGEFAGEPEGEPVGEQ